MTKAIEEAANEYASNWGAKHNIYNPELYAVITSAYKTGASHVLSLPLSQRLTDEERDWIKKIHEDELEFAQFYQRKANSCCNQQCKIDYEVARDIAKSRAGLVEAIFGKELFGEGEG